MAATLASTIQAYGALQRYADTGSVFSPGATGELEEARRFTTTFARGEWLALRVHLFELGDATDDQAHVIIDADCDARGQATLRLFGRRARRLPLIEALATASGVTSAASWFVPGLLLGLPEVVAWLERQAPIVARDLDAASPGRNIARIDSSTGLFRALEWDLVAPPEPAGRQRIELRDVSAA